MLTPTFRPQYKPGDEEGNKEEKKKNRCYPQKSCNSPSPDDVICKRRCGKPEPSPDEESLNLLAGILKEQHSAEHDWLVELLFGPDHIDAFTCGEGLRGDDCEQAIWRIEACKYFNVCSDSYIANLQYYCTCGITRLEVNNAVVPVGPSRTGRLSDPLPQGLSKRFVNAYDDIRAGRGVPQIDPRTAQQAVFQGRAPHERPWAGALEYRVPGTKGDQARILVKTLPDGRQVMGWTNSHYEQIHPFRAPHFPDAGW